MRGGLIAWTPAKLLALEEGIMIAEASGNQTVTWTEVDGPGGRFAKTRDHRFTLAEARDAAAQVKAALLNNPTPVFGENKEGREP